MSVVLNLVRLELGDDEQVRMVARGTNGEVVINLGPVETFNAFTTEGMGNGARTLDPNRTAF